MSHGPVVDNLGSCEIIFLIVVGAVRAFLPDEDCIAGGRVGYPAGVDFGPVADRLIEVVHGAAGSLIGDVLIIEPAAEGVTVAAHVSIGRSDRFLIGLQELRRVVGTALTVFIEDKPVTGRRVHAEGDVAGDVDVLTVLIRLIRSIVADDVGTAFVDEPALEVMLIVLSGIGHADSVGLRCLGRVGAEGHFDLTQGDVVFIQISDAVLSEEHGVVDDRGTVFIHACVSNACVRDVDTIIADVLDRLGGGGVSVVFVRGPAAEVHTIFKGSHAGVVENLRHVVALLDVDRFVRVVGSSEGHLQTRIITLADDNIDRERIALKTRVP